MSNEALWGKDRVAYTPQKLTVLFGALSKNPGLSSSGRRAKPSTCQESILLFTIKPSKLNRTFGPSRTSIKRPEPYSSSCLPIRSWIDFEPDELLSSRNADCKSS